MGLGTTSPLFFGAIFFSLAFYLAALATIGIKIVVEKGARGCSDARSIRTKGLAVFFVAECSLFFVGINSSWHYSEGTMLVLLAATMIALARVALPAPLHRSQLAWRVNEIVVLFLVTFDFLLADLPGSQASLPTIILYGIFTVAALALAGLRALDRTQPNSVRFPSSVSVLFALALTGVFVNYICMVAFDETSPYVWSALVIACAFVAIGAGFWFGEKPLRIYGLALALLGIFKIALIDISGEALVRAAALVAAGLVCFGISALYSYADKRIA